MPTTAILNSEAAIWTRIIDPEKNGPTPEAAHSLLRLTFREWDKTRMNELAQKNRKVSLQIRNGASWKAT